MKVKQKKRAIVQQKKSIETQVTAKERQIDNFHKLQSFQKPATTQKSVMVPSTDLSLNTAHMLWEDLQASKDQIHHELSQRENKSFQINVELESLRTENTRLKGLVRRYKNLIDEVKGNRAPEVDRLDIMKRDFEIRKSSIGTTIHSDDELNDKIKELNKSERGKSNDMQRTHFKPMSSHPLSFGFGKSVADNKRFEILNAGMPLFFKTKNPLDSTVALLNLIKNSFKGDCQAITLFVIDKDLMEKVINKHQEKKQYFKKLDLQNRPIYAVYTSSDQCLDPIFNDPAETLTYNSPAMIAVPVGPTNDPKIIV